MSTRIAALAGTVLLATAMNASAQTTWDGSIFVNVSAGVHAGSTDIDLSLAPTIYDEPAAVATSRSAGAGGVFDITGGLMIRESLGGAISFSTRSSSGDGTLTASIPDPIFFDRPRAVTDTIGDMGYSERWLGFLAAWVVPAGEQLDVTVLAGPAVAWVNVDAPAAVAVSEGATGPDVTVTLDSITKSFFGIQLGVDVRYMLTETVGVGGFARFQRASGEVQGGSDVTAGGFQLGGGVRFKF